MKVLSQSETKSEKRAIILVPTYNERENIERTVMALLRAFQDVPKHWQMSILVIDDSSPDGTGKIVTQLSQKFPNVYLHTNPVKSGLGGAYTKGMDVAFNKMQADVVFEFDADLQHDPTKIYLFLQKIDAGVDMVLGSRYMPGGGIPPSWGMRRKLASRLGNLFIMCVLCDFRLTDWTSGYRALTREVYDAVKAELKRGRFAGYTFQIGFLFNTVRKGFRVEMVPYVFTERIAGSSKIGFEYLKNAFLYIVHARLQEIVTHRIFKFGVVGGVGAMVQLISYSLLHGVLSYELAYVLAIELAVVSNFVLNNVWTFADRPIQLGQVPVKFVQFNISSAGSIGIQAVVGLVGKWLFGINPLLTLPLVSVVVDTGHILAVIGILIGMVVNYLVYTTIIWKKKTI